MYIEDRLFSENTDEVLYSIFMDEDEYALYSEFQKEFGIVQAVKNSISKIGNKLKRKAIAEAKEEIPKAVEKTKPKKVKRINKELKEEKLLDSLPEFYKSAREMVTDPHDRALMTAIQLNTARRMSM